MASKDELKSASAELIGEVVNFEELARFAFRIDRLSTQVSDACAVMMINVKNAKPLISNSL